MTASTKPDLEFHPLAEMFPLIGDDELRELGEDIRKNGLCEPITLYEGKILDGRNRYLAAKLIGQTLADKAFRQLPADMDPRAFVISENIQRRHLTAEQKRELLAKLIKADPSRSDRAIASVAKVDNKTVAGVRAKLEVTEEIPQTPTRTDKTGTKRPGRKKKNGPSPAKIYHGLQEKLMDALRDLNIEHAEDKVEETKDRLDETLTAMKEEELDEAA
jgi:ParB-like chromosome segregation protein Spo0J